jgi:hypothetical protein
MIDGSLKKFLDSNENEDTTYQNLWDTESAVLRRKFIDLSAHLRILKRSKINNLMIHLNLLQKQEQANPKSNRWI